MWLVIIYVSSLASWLAIASNSIVVLCVTTKFINLNCYIYHMHGNSYVCSNSYYIAIIKAAQSQQHQQHLLGFLHTSQRRLHWEGLLWCQQQVALERPASVLAVAIGVTGKARFSVSSRLYWNQRLRLGSGQTLASWLYTHESHLSTSEVFKGVKLIGQCNSTVASLQVVANVLDV